MSTSISSLSSSFQILNPSITEPLYQVKLLSALRSGDPVLIHPFLAEIGKDKRKASDGDVTVDTGAAALHLAVRCGSVQTISLLLSHRAISPNGIHPLGSGTTPLHLAASIGRTDVVNLLLEQEGIDDTLKDSNGKRCKEVARGKDVIRAIDDSHSFLNASYRSLLRSYILSPTPTPPPALISLLESPRSRFVNLSYLDDDSGLSLLHQAARRKDLRLIELAVRAGADVFVRNRRGKMAYDGLGKDDRVRVFLRQFANHDTTLIESPLLEPPTMKGYLNKYTNVARGYNTRWFVLKGGILSYYRHQEDETIASRGSISLKTGVLRVSPPSGGGGDKLRFEVHTKPSRGHHHSQSVERWYMKANHPVEASRWTQAIGKSIEWYKREAAKASTHSNSSNTKIDQRSIESESDGVYKSSFRGSISSMVLLSRKKPAASEGDSVHSSEDGASPILHSDRPSGCGGEGDGDGDGDGDGHLANDGSSAAESTGRVPPHDGTFDLHGNATLAQMELTLELLANPVLPPSTSTPAMERAAALKDSLAMAHGMLDEYVQMVREREEWWSGKLEREREREGLWEESLASVVKEGEALESELRARSRRRGSRFFDDGQGTLKLRLSQLRLPRSPPALPEEFFSRANVVTAQAVSEGSIRKPRRSSTVKPPPPIPAEVPSTSGTSAVDEADEIDTDDEDEFFDAIEANTLPLVVHEALTSPAHATPSFPPNFNMQPYAGYSKMRTRLGITGDERPSTSLWSVLKHSIGKDLTKISFPVFFNEPTSMLQRMAEDMEFSECLDVAARESDAHRRIAFVAAFAMSNYSSTIGRIAKPFNPMLSETFEYVRLDKEYRYVSEQVSHHPPISACWAESPLWQYYGEVDAQNKFMGKSFEIRPTGVAHADLLLSEKLAPRYPKAAGDIGAGKVLEHYSWKKVTTNVSGFIFGSPTIDHYGDMIITNHRTKDRCILTFKPRGWRGKDAYEISGQVQDSTGKVVYEIAGRWNSQLVARAVGTGSGFLHPDISLSGPKSPSAPEYILLWRNSEKPSAPFNLTPFAITLNDCPEDTLRPFLCPTDCRLRPDQRAFERGRYELANGYKNMQEEKQRATRKAREERRVPPHAPRWFAAETDGDTGERVWAPARVGDKVEYWAERESVWKAGGRTQWKGVDPIFIDPPEGGILAS